MGGVTSPPMGGSDVTTHRSAKNEFSNSDFHLEKINISMNTNSIYKIKKMKIIYGS